MMNNDKRLARLVNLVRKPWRNTSSADCRRTVTFYGFSERSAVAAYAFDVQPRQLKDATAAWLKTRSKKLKLTTSRNRAALFRAGWGDGMRRVIVVFRVTERETQLMIRWMDNQNMKTAIIRELKSCRGGDIARHRGYKAGKRARLHHGVEGEKRLLPWGTGRTVRDDKT